MKDSLYQWNNGNQQKEEDLRQSKKEDIIIKND